MGFRINTNIDSQKATNSLQKTNISLSKSYERLSSGFRITEAADDVAGLALTSKIDSYSASVSQAIRNASDGIALSQTAEGAMNEIYNNINRIRELAIQSSSGTVTNSERSYINTESAMLISEIDRIANTTKFNGMVLLNGNSATGIGGINFEIWIGFKGEKYDQYNISLGSHTSNQYALNTIRLDTSSSALAALTTIDNAITKVTQDRTEMGTAYNVLQSAISSNTTLYENMRSSASLIKDVDFATETSNMSRKQIIQQAGVSILSQTNFSSQNVLSLVS